MHLGFQFLDKQNKFLYPPFLPITASPLFSIQIRGNSIKQAALDTSFVTLGLQKAAYYTNVIHPNSVFYDLSGNYNILNFSLYQHL